MTYAAQLLDAAKSALKLTTYKDLANALAVDPTAISQWKLGKGSPMPPERVMELCELAHIADPGPWLIGVQTDAVRITGIRAALESVLDRARPTITTAGIVGAVMLAAYFHTGSTDASSALLAFVPALPLNLGIMRNGVVLGVVALCAVLWLTQRIRHRHCSKARHELSA